MHRFSRFCLVALVGVASSTSRAAGYADEVLTDQPAGYWRLAESTPPPVPVAAINRGGEGPALNGVYRGGVLLGQPGAVAGDGNTSALFTPASGQNVEIPYSPVLNDAFTLTVELWARVTGGAGIRTAFSSMTTSGANNYGYALVVTANNEWQFRTGQGSGGEAFNVVTGPPATIGAWTHLAGVYNGNVNPARTDFWVNGQWAGAVAGLAEMNPSAPLRIGSGSVGDGTPTQLFAGGIDEVAVYSRALSGAEIAGHYQAGAAYATWVFQSQPAGYWRLDEPDAGAPVVAANLGRLGTNAAGAYLTGAAGDQPGALLTDPANHSAGFDGAEAQVGIPWRSDLNASNFTVECWARASGGFNLLRGIVSSRTLTADNHPRGYGLELGPGENWRFRLGDGKANWTLLAGPLALADTWSHLVGSFDGNIARFYVDGALVDAQRVTAAINLDHPLSVGGASLDSLPLAVGFTGEVDEVAVFTNALSDARVLAHYQASGRQNPTPVAPSIVEEPIGQTNYVGSSVTFTVGATGSLPLQYQWRLRGLAIPDATTPSLTIPFVQTTDAGAYSVEVANRVAKSLSADALLTVNPVGPPVIVEQPQSLAVFAGGSARFDVGAVGSTNLTYQWQFNSTDLAGETNASLRVRPATAARQGAYRVRVGTQVAIAYSDPVTLAVAAVPAGTYPAAIMDDQPVAYWRLGERTDLFTYDVAGGRTSDIIGAVTLGRPGALAGDANTAFGFVNGFQAHVKTAFDTDLNPLPVTVETWARPTGSATVERTAIASADAAGGFQVRTSAQGRWELVGLNGSASTILTGPAITSGKWQHLAASWDGTAWRLFINGIEAGRRTASARPNASAPFRIGAGVDNFGLVTSYFEGDLDEVAVYDQALTSDRILSHYSAGIGAAVAPVIVEQPQNQAAFPGFTVTQSVVAEGSLPLLFQWQHNEADLAGQTNRTLVLTNVATAAAGRYRVRIVNGVGTTTSDTVNLSLVTLPGQSYSDAVRADTPASYWRLDETAGLTAFDIVGFRHGSYQAGVILGRAGIPAGGTAAYFTAVGQSRVEVPYAAALNPAVFSVEAWVRLTGPAGHHLSAVASRLETPQRGYALCASDTGFWEFWTGRGDPSGWEIITGPAAETDRWAHLVATSDGIRRRFYVNGILVGTSSAPFAVNDLNPFRIGGDQLVVDGSFFLDGGVDEVAVYGKALTPERILIHYGLGTSISGLPTLSLTRTGNHATVTWTNGTLQAAAFITGPYGYVAGTAPLTITFDGSAQYYRVRQ